MKSFNSWMIEVYPGQQSPPTGKKEYENPDAGDWVLGDPPNPIEGWEGSDSDSVLAKSSEQIRQSRGTN
jgi:hypothetical protein